MSDGRPDGSGRAADRVPIDRAWRRRGYQMLGFRAGLGAVCIAILSVQGVRGPLALSDLWPLQAVALLVLLDGAFFLLTRLCPWPRVLVSVQIGVDLLAAHLLIYATGGAGSVFTFLPFAHVIMASVLLSGYASLFYASLATVLLAVVSLAYSMSYVGLMRLPGIAPDWVVGLQPMLPRTLAMVAGQGVALHVVATLGGSLAARLRRETSLKDEILDNIAEGLIVADAGLRVVFVNSEAIALLGFQRADQLVGRPWRDIFRRRGDRQVRLMLSDQETEDDASESLAPLTVGRSRVIEFEHRERGKLHLSVKTSPFRRSHDAMGGVVAIFHDITAERVMEAVQERADRLREISLVAAGIAHELRNPLASIRGCVQELAAVQAADHRTERLARIVASETDRLDKIITEFLNFARMRPPRPAPCPLDDVIEEVIVLLRSQRDLDRIEVETDVARGLEVTADRDQLKQVLLNLTRNAVDAMSDAANRPARLLVTASPVPRLPGERPAGRADGGAVRIEVADTGCGIAPDQIGHLFTPFFTTKAKGTGMGLSIVERIVRTHDGHLEVDSRPGVGSTFRLWLPVSPRRRRADDASLWDPGRAAPHRERTGVGRSAAMIPDAALAASTANPEDATP